jgi:hypothetical protein
MLRRMIPAVVVAATLTGCSAGQDTAAAETAVHEFRQLLGAERYLEIYMRAAPDMRVGASEEGLADRFRAVRARLGTFRSASRTNVSWNKTNLGTAVTLGYDARYANGRARETFVYRVLMGQAQLAGYAVQIEGTPDTVQIGAMALRDFPRG